MASVTGLMVLGILAEGPRTAYELVQHLRRPSMAAVLWDASERTLYREPARLVEAGLAALFDDPSVETPRYCITEEGRTALLAMVPWDARFSFRNEVLATVYAAAGLPPAEVRARLVQIRDAFLDGIEDLAALLHEMAARGPSLPNRAVVTALLGRVHVEGLLLTCRWADEAIAALDEVTAEVDPVAFASDEWESSAERLDEFVVDMRSRHGDRPLPTVSAGGMG